MFTACYKNNLTLKGLISELYHITEVELHVQHMESIEFVEFYLEPYLVLL